MRRPTRRRAAAVTFAAASTLSLARARAEDATLLVPPPSEVSSVLGDPYANTLLVASLGSSETEAETPHEVPFPGSWIDLLGGSESKSREAPVMGGALAALEATPLARGIAIGRKHAAHASTDVRISPLLGGGQYGVSARGSF